MKTLRNLLVLASFLFLAFNAEAQWANNPPHIFNTNTGNVGIGINPPSYLLHVAKNMTEPAITIQNLGGIGGATYRMIDNVSGADWKFKATNLGGFKVRDQASSLDVFVIEQNSAANCIYIGSNDVIGFGTNAPFYHPFGGKLDVQGDILVQDNNAFVIVDNTLSGSNSGVCMAASGTYKGWMFYDESADYVRINCDFAGFANQLVLHSNGDVGVGTATTKTGYKLSVDGKVA